MTVRAAAAVPYPKLGGDAREPPSTQPARQAHVRGERNRTTGGPDGSVCHAAIRSRSREKLRKCRATMD